MKMFRSIVSSLVIVGLVSCAPGPYSASGVQPPAAPARQVASVQCRTEYTTVWDTKYQEKETQECVTVYEDVCQTVFERQCQPTVRKEV